LIGLTAKMSIFNIDMDDEGTRLDRSMCSVIDEMNQVKDRLRKTKQRRSAERKELKTMKKELEAYSSWAEDQSCMISSLKRDRAKLMHKIRNSRTYILVLKHMLSSSETAREELTKEFNSKNVSYRNLCSKAKSTKKSLENKIQRIKETELKRHHLEDGMRMRQAKRDDRLAKTRAGLASLERARENVHEKKKSTDTAAATEEHISSPEITDVESKWNDIIKPYGSNVRGFLDMFESKKRDLEARKRRLKELQESSDVSSSVVAEDGITKNGYTREMQQEEGDVEDDEEEEREKELVVENNNNNNNTPCSSGIDKIVQSLSQSHPTINWQSLRSHLLEIKQDGPVVELKIKI